MWQFLFVQTLAWLPKKDACFFVMRGGNAHRSTETSLDRGEGCSPCPRPVGYNLPRKIARDLSTRRSQEVPGQQADSSFRKRRGVILA